MCRKVKMKINGILNKNVIFIENKIEIEYLMNLGYGAKKLRPLEVNIHNENKEDIYSLILMDEEVIYLYEINQLVVYSSNYSNLLTIQELWEIFYHRNQSFPIKYKTYQYFRLKGFFLRYALNYGLDYSVYRHLPSQCHAEMCLFVINGIDPSEQDNLLSWKHLSSLTRILPNVNKILLLCYVLPLNSIPISSINLNLITSLELLRIQPISSLVRRFGMSATSLESHQIHVIQKKYYQNSLLHVSRQESINKPNGATRRKRRKKKNNSNNININNNSHNLKDESKDNELNEDENEDEIIDNKNEETQETQEINNSKSISSNNSNNNLLNNDKKKVTKRSIHWIALTNETNQVNDNQNKNNDTDNNNNNNDSRQNKKLKVEVMNHQNIQHQEREKEEQSFFGWLLSYFHS